MHDWTMMLIYVCYLCVKNVFVCYVSNSICLFTLSVVGNLVVLVYHVNSVFCLNLNSTPILKSFVFCTPMADDFSFELITSNVRGLREFKKRRKIFNWIKKHTSKGSIMLLQETHSDEKIENIWTSQWHGDLRFSHWHELSNGVLDRLWRKSTLQCHKEHKDNEGRFLIIECSIQDQPFLIINRYNPNIESEWLLKTL